MQAAEIRTERECSICVSQQPRLQGIGHPLRDVLLERRGPNIARLDRMNEILEEVYRTRTVQTPDGAVIPLQAEAARHNTDALYRTILEFRPTLAVEIGLANGLTALSMLSAMEKAGVGKLISIDPNQASEWRDVGVANIARAGLAHRHELVQEFDYLALPDLVRKGTRIQFAYIDGWHTFDYVALDHFYIDKMLEIGGVIGFNDAGQSAVHRAISLLTTNRRYREIDVGLPTDYRGRNAAMTLARRILRRSQSDRYFVKLDQFEPYWHFYKRF